MERTSDSGRGRRLTPRWRASALHLTMQEKRLTFSITYKPGELPGLESALSMMGKGHQKIIVDKLIRELSKIAESDTLAPMYVARGEFSFNFNPKTGGL